MKAFAFHRCVALACIEQFVQRKIGLRNFAVDQITHLYEMTGRIGSVEAALESIEHRFCAVRRNGENGAASIGVATCAALCGHAVECAFYIEQRTGRLNAIHCAIFGAFLVDKVGRRPLLLFSFTSCCVVWFGMTIASSRPTAGITKSSSTRS